MNEIKKLNEPKEITGSELLCPIRYVLDIVGGKWKLAILCILSSGGVIRYNSLKRKLNGITNMMLAQSLKELEAANMINRAQYNEIPPRVEYSLTEKGKSIVPNLINLAKWGLENMEDEPNCSEFCKQCRNLK